MNSVFDSWAKKRKWRIGKEYKPFPKEIIERYNNLPNNWLSFIEGYSSIMNEEENIWFLTSDSFYPKREDEWRYNEFELISISSTDGDEDLLREVKNYWNNHIPIVMSVKNGYKYYAIEINSGCIVCGFEPEFEEAETVANSFEEFIDMIMRDKLF